MRYSVIIPIYKNEATIPNLLKILYKMNDELEGLLEAVFVIDGSPDDSFNIIHNELADLPFPAQLIAHSRNFGAFAALRTGLQAARGEFFGVMAADLQEPPELLVEFFKALSADECDVTIGTRTGRKDPFISRINSKIFWGLYRRLVVQDMPSGGVDVFGCNRLFRDQLLKLEESRSSLIALIFWLGFRRKLVGYERQVRLEGTSAWTLQKKIDYMLDSVFAFTDLPIRILINLGGIGFLITLTGGFIVLIGKISGMISVPGYAATMLSVLGLGAMNLLGLGLVGTYAWRAYENSKQRPIAVVISSYKNAHTSM